jgi:hypothetical protein
MIRMGFKVVVKKSSTPGDPDNFDNFLRVRALACITKID